MCMLSHSLPVIKLKSAHVIFYHCKQCFEVVCKKWIYDEWCEKRKSAFFFNHSALECRSAKIKVRCRQVYVVVMEILTGRIKVIIWQVM